MKRDARGLMTGLDYTLGKPARRPVRHTSVLLGLLALSAFGLAWTLREDASAAGPAAATTPVQAAAQAPAVASPASPVVAAAAPSPSPVPQHAVDHHRAPLSPFAAVRRDAATPAVAVATTAAPATAIEVAAVQPDREARAEEIEALRGVTPEGDDDLADDLDAVAAAPAPATVEETLKLPKGLKLRSNVVLVVDQKTDEIIAGKNPDLVQPIASLTKLMTALIVTEAKQPLDEVLEISKEDIDHEKNTYSRLKPGMKFTREDLLILALMSSENRAASALGRYYPGGRAASLQAMNNKARALGMTHTHYADSNGLSPHNVSTARDLVKLAAAAYEVPLIRKFSTQTHKTVKPGRSALQFVSSNRLVRAKNDWRIGLQKTGFTNEAGRCLLMQATVKGRPLIMVLLDSDGKLTRFADANRVRQWLERGNKPATKKAGKPARRAGHSSSRTSRG